jgi:DNA-binding transcriptional MerR regulator
MRELGIGDLARIAATKVQTIRYYEEIGLIRASARTEGGHRLFDEKAIERLKFVRHARELGFGIDEIRELLDLSDSPETSCATADKIAQAHLQQIEIRLKKLRALRQELRRMIDECHHGRVSQCRVIEVLKDHRHCTHEH